MMKIARWFTLPVLAFGFVPNSRAAEIAVGARVIELRTYTAMPGKLDALLARFREHTLKLFERHGMENLGYWVPTDAKDGAGEKLVYLLAHASREAAAASWAAFKADPDWQAVSRASEVNGKIVAKTESVFLAATDFSPAFIASIGHGAPRVFELRTYTAAPGKLAALDARFRGGETALFAKSGMTGVGFFHPLDADQGAEHVLIYLLAHANREAATASWNAFRTDPAWVKLKAESEKDGKLTATTVAMFLAPTDFSPTK
jgi:hypothetical protein